MAWSLAAIEFVAWSVLEEEGSGEQGAEAALDIAYRTNPFLAWNIAHMEIFDEVSVCLWSADSQARLSGITRKQPFPMRPSNYCYTAKSGMHWR